MTTPVESPNESASNSVSHFIETVRRAFSEFLKVPTAIIIAFLFLAVFSYLLDRSQIGWLRPVRELLKRHVFANPKATSDLLGAVAAGIITMTSVTISFLLIAVQQAASSMTSAVVDQFLRRRHNQIYFGFFIGIALYALITLGHGQRSVQPSLWRHARLHRHGHRALSPHPASLHDDQSKCGQSR